MSINTTPCRTLLLFTGLLFGSLSLAAQPGRGAPDGDNREGRSERMEKFQIAYLTQELDFTTEEAQKFWPLFNANEASKKALVSRREKILDGFADDKRGTSSEVQTNLERVREIEVQLVNLRYAFALELLEAFDADMAIDFMEAQKGFRRAMLDAVRQQGKSPGKSGNTGRPAGRNRQR